MASNIDNDEESLHDFLKRKDLEKYLPQFQEQGAHAIQDVLDGVDKHVLVSDIGMTSLEANKFLKLIEQYKVSCCTSSMPIWNRESKYLGFVLNVNKYNLTGTSHISYGHVLHVE